jgi:hypothetical protein
MVALEPLTKQFRQVNNLDLVNLVIVHDGDADSVNAHIQMKDGYDGTSFKGGSYFDISSTNVYIKDRNSKLQVKISNEPHKYWSYNDGMRVAIFDWFRATTGAKIFGFFIAGEGRSMRQQLTAKYINKDGQSVYEMVDKKYGLTGNNNRYFDYDKSEFVKELASQVKKDKFIQSYNKGYDSFFIMPGGSDLKVEDEELEIEGKVTASKLKNAFMKMNKKKQVNRVMVSRFIDGIAA